MRSTFTDVLIEAAAKNNNIWLLAGDLGYSVLEPFVDRYPERYVNAGVAEQNMIGVAAGLALSGKKVFIYSIANFPTFRCFEQIRNDICYHNLDVKITAVGGGFTYGSHGYTHHGIEDLSILRALPNIEIIAPADQIEAGIAARHLTETPGPAYLRLGKNKEPIVHSRPPVINPGQPVEVVAGSDIAVLATGAIVRPSMDAAREALQGGISVAVYSVPWIKPMECDSIRGLGRCFKVIITVEEANASGGLGGAVAEIIAEMPDPHARVRRLGVPNSILEVAHDQESARRQVGIDSASILSEIRRQAEEIR